MARAGTLAFQRYTNRAIESVGKPSTVTVAVYYCIGFVLFGFLSIR